MNNIKRIGILALSSLMLCGCSGTEEPKTISYEEWKLSDKAYDYDNDRKITENDYQIYLDFNTWLLSDDAIDLNGDHQITYEDYLLSKQEVTPFEKWATSEDAFDFNGDGSISSADYDYYMLFKDDIGLYAITDFTVTGNITNTYLAKTKMPFNSFVNIILRSRLELNKKSKPIISISDRDKELIGEDYPDLESLLAEMVFTKRTDKLCELVTSVSYNGVKTSIVFYLQKDTTIQSENAYISNFTISLGDGSVTADGFFKISKIDA